ncbi:Protein bem46 [Astathelohania contejeani]|uniref:Protein bem46 n=1 Tax=Astathelohania contejeani TaxID=164912 RepID=A0ABQ7I2D2_9MICR|nr:Protein bem46 [Thelohania contejeani]
MKNHSTSIYIPPKVVKYINIILVCMPFLCLYSIFTLFTIQNSLIYKTKTQDHKMHGFTNYNKLITADNTILDTYMWDKKENVDLIVFHGSIVKISNHNKICLKFFNNMNVNVLTLFYRGFKTQQERPDEIGIMLDVYAFFEYVIKERKDKRYVLYGTSMGCATALYFANLLIANNIKNFIMIIENPFYNFTNLITQKYLFLSFICSEKWPNDKRIANLKKIEIPILLILSGKDEIIDNKNGLKLIKNTSNCEVFRNHEATHFNGYKYENFHIKINQFINEKS